MTDNWKPISEAPTDEEVLIYHQDSGSYYVAFLGTEIISGDKAWVFARDFERGLSSIVRNPTHFMLLPKPPVD